MLVVGQRLCRIVVLDPSQEDIKTVFVGSGARKNIINSAKIDDIFRFFLKVPSTNFLTPVNFVNIDSVNGS